MRVEIEMGGTEDQRLLVATMRRTSPAECLAVFNHKGKLIYSNSTMATLLGYKTAKMKGMDISELMEPPFGCLHHR